MSWENILKNDARKIMENFHTANAKVKQSFEEQSMARRTNPNIFNDEKTARQYGMKLLTSLKELKKGTEEYIRLLESQ